MSANRTFLSFSEKDIAFLLLAGLIGEAILEAYSWFIVPMLAGVPMRPHLLVTALGQNQGGFAMSAPLAVTIHLLLGFAIFPALYLWLKRRLGLKSWVFASIAFGVLLWCTAQMVLAPLAGRPFMLGAGPILGLKAYTWASLVAHTGYMLVVAYVFETLTRRSRDWN